MFKCAILTVSDRCAKGSCEDLSGPAIKEIIQVKSASVVRYDIVPDEIEMIEERLKVYCCQLEVDVVLTTGGTGLGPRDVTPEATKKVSAKIVPGISELIRQEGLKKQKTPRFPEG